MIHNHVFFFSFFSFLIHDDSHGCLLNRYIRGANGSEQAGIVLHTTKTASNPHHKQDFFFLLEKAQFTLPATSPPTCTLPWICLTSRELEMEKNGMNLLLSTYTLPISPCPVPRLENSKILTVAFGFGMLGSDHGARYLFSSGFLLSILVQDFLHLAA